MGSNLVVSHFPPIKLCTDLLIYWGKIPDIIHAHLLVRESQLPFFGGMHIPFKLDLNVDRWRHHLTGCFNQKLPDLLEFGFPLDFLGLVNLVSLIKIIFQH